MIVDSSVLVSVLMRGPEYRAVLEQLYAAEVLGIAAPTLVDAAMRLSRLIARDVQHFALEFVQQAQMEILPFEDQHFHSAVDAFQRWGRSEGAEGLCFADCLTYAVAFHADKPILTTNAAFRCCDIPIVLVEAAHSTTDTPA